MGFLSDAVIEENLDVAIRVSEWCHDWTNLKPCNYGFVIGAIIEQIWDLVIRLFWMMP